MNPRKISILSQREFQSIEKYVKNFYSLYEETKKYLDSKPELDNFPILISNNIGLVSYNNLNGDINHRLYTASVNENKFYEFKFNL